MDERNTRSKTENFLIGQSESDVPGGMLPTRGDVLRLVCWHKSQSPQVPLSCPWVFGTKTTKCE